MQKPRGPAANGSPQLDQFDRQSYLNLETYRRNGAAVGTPVWFARDGHGFYVHTQADAGKVKRIRHNEAVRVVPCGAQGEPKGEWIRATAAVMPEAEWARIDKLMQAKYGILWSGFLLLGKVRGTRTVKIKITPDV